MVCTCVLHGLEAPEENIKMEVQKGKVLYHILCLQSGRGQRRADIVRIEVLRDEQLVDVVPKLRIEEIMRVIALRGVFVVCVAVIVRVHVRGISIVAVDAEHALIEVWRRHAHWPLASVSRQIAFGSKYVAFGASVSQARRNSQSRIMIRQTSCLCGASSSVRSLLMRHFAFHSVTFT